MLLTEEQIEGIEDSIDYLDRLAQENIEKNLRSLLDHIKAIQEEVDTIEIKTVRNARIVQCMFCHNGILFETEPVLINPLNWGHQHKYTEDSEPAPCAAGPLWEYEQELIKRRDAPPDR